jgi:hypothetical protein
MYLLIAAVIGGLLVGFIYLILRCTGIPIKGLLIYIGAAIGGFGCLIVFLSVFHSNPNQDSNIADNSAQTFDSQYEGCDAIDTTFVSKEHEALVRMCVDNNLYAIIRLAHAYMRGDDPLDPDAELEGVMGLHDDYIAGIKPNWMKATKLLERAGELGTVTWAVPGVEYSTQYRNNGTAVAIKGHLAGSARVSLADLLHTRFAMLTEYGIAVGEGRGKSEVCRRRAQYWLEKAASQGWAPAMCECGKELDADGRSEEAMRYYEKAANAGDDEASKLLRRPDLRAKEIDKRAMAKTLTSNLGFLMAVDDSSNRELAQNGNAIGIVGLLQLMHTLEKHDDAANTRRR